MKMLKEMGVKMNSISLDRYYSTRKTLKVFGKETAVYVIPEKNLARIGFDWLIRQKREDRREMALFAIGLWHNVFAIRVR